MSIDPSKKGSYSRQLIKNTPADTSSPFYNQCKSVYKRFPEEAFYIYSFAEKRMLYNHGWEKFVGIPDSKLGMVDVVDLTAPDFKDFVEEVNDKALMFLYTHSENLKDYCFQIHIRLSHMDGSEIPVSAKVAVYDTFEDGSLKAICGSFRSNDSLRFGAVMRLSSYGPEKREFEDALDPELFQQLIITEKEAEALKLAANGLTDIEIADQIGISKHSVDKRFRSIKKRFGCRSRTALLQFAFDNYLL
jgi:DNA-binding CsgD family transcriptional regulator